MPSKKENVGVQKFKGTALQGVHPPPSKKVLRLAMAVALRTAAKAAHDTEIEKRETAFAVIAAEASKLIAHHGVTGELVWDDEEETFYVPRHLPIDNSAYLDLKRRFVELEEKSLPFVYAVEHYERELEQAEARDPLIEARELASTPELQKYLARACARILERSENRLSLTV